MSYSIKGNHEKSNKKPPPAFCRKWFPLLNLVTLVDRLVAYIEKLNGIGDKNKLADAVQKEFSLVQDRKVYYCNDFAIRFSKSESKRMSNTVLSLSALQKYDDKPFFVCIVASTVNYLLLANSTFLKKISHSSKELRIDNIKGSFNGGDIMLVYDEMDNEPQFFDRLYAYHSGLSFVVFQRSSMPCYEKCANTQIVCIMSPYII